MPHRAKALVLSVLAVGVVAGMAACSGGDSLAARHKRIQGNPAPELKTLYQRHVDVENQFALMANENMRMFHQDISRALYTDRPSRLTREPVPRY